MQFEMWLREQDLTYTEVAKRLGCSRPTVKYWASGKHMPRPRYIKSIAKLTDGEVTFADFLAHWERQQ